MRIDSFIVERISNFFFFYHHCVISDSIQREGPMDNRDSIHFFGVLSDSTLRCPLIEILRSILLDESNTCVQ